MIVIRGYKYWFKILQVYQLLSSYIRSCNVLLGNESMNWIYFLHYLGDEREHNCQFFFNGMILSSMCRDIFELYSLTSLIVILFFY